MVRSSIQLKDLAPELKEKYPFSDRLIYLNREIVYLERKLVEPAKVLGWYLLPPGGLKLVPVT